VLRVSPESGDFFRVQLSPRDLFHRINGKENPKMRFLTRTLLTVVTIAILAVTAFAQSARDDLLKQLEAKHAELLKDLKQIESQILLPSEEDRQANAEFLAQADTGLVRLLPREIYDSYDHPERRLGIRGGGSYYSFTRNTHEYGRGTQIGLEQEQIKSSFAGADYGLIANLGDRPLDSLTLEEDTVNALVSYERAKDEPRARAEYQRFVYGDKIGETIYKTTLPAKVNNTYLLRGIHYSDSDVVVAFRVVRKDTDGSLVLAWRLLKTYPKPELTRTNQSAN
jgi:hypothetical protein